MALISQPPPSVPPDVPLAHRRKGERGLAIVMVLSMVVVIATVLAEIIFQLSVTARTSVGERDRERAEMAAITGAQFAKMLIMVDTAVTRLPKEAAEMVRSQLGGKKIYELLDGFPIGAEGLDEIGDLAKLNINAALDASLLEALRAVPGYFVVRTTNESAKLNVNLLGGAERRSMEEALSRLFSTQREEKFLEEKGYPGKRLVANLVDYIDANKTDNIDKSEEEEQYRQAKFTHGPKNGPLESLEELRRIPGFHVDEIYDLFSPYLTVWPMVPLEKSLDINSAPVELLAALVTPEGGEMNESSLDQLEDDRAEGKFVTEARNITQFFTQIAGGAQVPSGIAQRIAGLESSCFKVEVRGVSNGIERTYVLVLDRSPPKVIGAPPIRVVYQRFH